MHLRFKVRKFEIIELAALKKTIQRLILIGLAYWFLLIPTLIMLPFFVVLFLSRSLDISSTFTTHFAVIFTIVTWLLGGAVAFLRGLENILYARLMSRTLLKQPTLPVYTSNASKKDRCLVKRHSLVIAPHSQQHVDVEVWFHKEYRNNYLYTIHYVPLHAQDDVSAEQDGRSRQFDVQAYRATLFADQPLESLLYASDFENDQILRQAIRNFQQDAFLEGCRLLQSTINQSQPEPLRILAIVLAHIRLGKVTKARQILRDVTLIPEFGSQVQLWAWTALRWMGEEINERTAQQVLGVILEIPAQQGVNMLTAYLDGRASYISPDNKIMNWGSTQGKICDLAHGVIQAAQSISGDISLERKRLPIQKGQIRISVLTCGGIRVHEERENDAKTKQSKAFPIFIASSSLLAALTELS